MRKWKSPFWMIVPVLLGLSACQEDEEIPRQDLLIGTWMLEDQSIEQVTVSSGENQLTFSEEEFIQFLAISGEDTDVESLRLFDENSTFTFSEDRTYVVEDTDGTATIAGDWSLSESETKLTFGIASESLLFTILSLSQNRMQTNFTFNEIDDGILYQIDFIFTFTK